MHQNTTRRKRSGQTSDKRPSKHDVRDEFIYQYVTKMRTKRMEWNEATYRIPVPVPTLPRHPRSSESIVDTTRRGNSSNLPPTRWQCTPIPRPRRHERHGFPKELAGGTRSIHKLNIDREVCRGMCWHVTRTIESQMRGTG